MRCRSMNSESRLWLVVNGASGSHDEETVREILARLERAGTPPARVVDCREDGLPARPMLEQAGVNLLAVHGGDGTLNAAITGLEGWGGAVLALPGGTANLLCGMLYGAAGLAEIVALFGAGRLGRRHPPCIWSSAGAGLAEILAGPGAAWSDVREDLRRGNVADMIADALDAASQSAGGPMVGIADPPLGREEGYAGVLMRPAAGRMAVRGYGAQELADYWKQGLALLQRDFREGPHDELGAHRMIRCRSLAYEPIALMIDGERRAGRRDEQFTLAELQLDLLCRRDG